MANAHLDTFGFILSLLGLQRPLYQQLLQFLIAVIYAELFKTRGAGILNMQVIQIDQAQPTHVLVST